jgi:hypothetical protein
LSVNEVYQDKGAEGDKAQWPAAVGWYLPKTRAVDPDRWRKARVPPAVSLLEIALSLLDQARLWGVPHRCVADADDGDDPHFPIGSEARQERYVVGVRADF